MEIKPTAYTILFDLYLIIVKQTTQFFIWSFGYFFTSTSMYVYSALSSLATG